MTTIKDLNSKYRYDSKSGKILDRKTGKEKFNTTNVHGYKQGQHNGQKLLKHRVVYALKNGRWPKGPVDHKDGNRTNNKPSNLKNSNSSSNMKNKTRYKSNNSGVTGVVKRPNGTWKAYININGKQKHLGVFKTKTAAANARRKASTKNKFSKRHGS